MEALYAFLFADGGYSPHGYCIAWNLPVLFTHIGSDLLIAVSYFAIPAIMLVFLRRRNDPRLTPPALLFAAFIALCGLTHLMSIVTMYLPFYGFQGVLKALTGIMSFVTAVAIWRMMPDALRIPAPEALLRALAQKEGEISEHRKTQATLTRRNRQLDQKMRELEAANRELREFSYAASHDLKAPANTLRLWLDCFSEEHGRQLDQTAREDLAEAGEIVDRMRALVDDVLTYSRLVNLEEQAREPVSMNAVFDRALSDLRAEIEEAGAEIDIAPMPAFGGYSALLAVLAHNLLSNALKFRAPGRACRVEVRGDIASGTPPAFVLRVRDNGIGIAPEHGERIFGMFQRLHRDDDIPGTGLGLPLCRRAALAHGGTIRVESAADAGAEFVVTLPMEVADVPDAA